MSSQGVATTAVYLAFNTSTGAYVTGDVSNHTLKLVKDGTEASPTNSPSEVDSTNAPGAYKLALTTAETSYGTVWIGGKSSTSSVIIIPITLTFETPGQVLTTVLTESYASLHSVPTLTQLLLELRALLAENSISSTTMTTKKIDGSTTAHTYTLNSSTAPTSLTTAG